MNIFLIGLFLIGVLMLLLIIPRMGGLTFIFLILFVVIIFVAVSYRGSSFNLSMLSNPETGMYRSDITVHWWVEDGNPRVEIVGVSFDSQRKYDVTSITPDPDEIKNVNNPSVYRLNVFVNEKYVYTRKLYDYSGMKTLRVFDLESGEARFGVEILDVSSNKKDYTEKVEVIKE